MEQVPTFSSYRDHIAALLQEQPELTWLQDFLNQTDTKHGSTKVFICDIIDTLHVRECKNCSDLNSSLEMADAKADVTVKLVIVCYTEIEEVDRDVVDVVAHHFDLDPYLLIQHFRPSYPEFGDLEEEDRFIMDYPAAALKGVWPIISQSSRGYTLRDTKSAVLSFRNFGACIAAGNKHHSNNSKWSTLLSLREFFELNNSLDILFIREDRDTLAHHFLSHSPTAPNETDRIRAQILLPMVKDHILEALVVSIRETKSRNSASYANLLLLVVENFVAIACADGQTVLRYVTANFDLMVLESDEGWGYNYYLFATYWRISALKHRILGIELSMSQEAIGSSFTRVLCVLESLCQNLKEMRDWANIERQKNHDRDSSNLMKKQLIDAEKSIKTSAQVGRLSQLAYIFLPLQLTTSILGMNLKMFGSGTLAFTTFTTILALVGSLAMFATVLSAPWLIKAASRAISARPYSTRVALIFTLFCLTHSEECADRLWSDTGIEYDVMTFRGDHKGPRTVGAYGWEEKRQALTRELGKGRFFGRSWSSRLTELYQIIDAPLWGRSDPLGPDGRSVTTQVTADV